MGSACSNDDARQDTDLVAACAVRAENLQLDASTAIEYLTDVEGNWDYFMRFIEESKVLFWDGSDCGVWGPGTLQLRPDTMLVFGGDASDKGPGDIRTVKILLDLKHRFPSQCFIVLGNRDLMKIRFYAELHAESSDDGGWIPTWAPKTLPYNEWLQTHSLPACPVNKCKWSLDCTMGCQDTTFNTRRNELAMINGSACDEDVVKSYTSSVDPKSDDPWMLNFVRAGQLAVLLGDSLFVHGGVSDESLGYVPGQEHYCGYVLEWVQKLNSWKDREVLDFMCRPGWYKQGNEMRRGGADLIAYGTPSFGNKTIIYHNPFVDGNPVQRSQAVQDFLQRSKVRRVLSGHQPHGQLPTVVRHLKTGLLVLTCDTSRSDNNGDKLFNPANYRGECVTVVRIQGPQVYLEGQRSDRVRHACKLHTDPTKDTMPDALVGRQLTDGSWVKSVDSSTGEPIVAKGKGWNIEVRNLSVNGACLKLTHEYGYAGSHKVHLKDLSAQCLMEAKTSMEDCTDLDNEATRDKFGFDVQAFDEATTYIFASITGVFTSPNTVEGKKIQAKINNMIALGKRVLFITNDSSLSRRSMWDKLVKEHGLSLHRTMSSCRLKNESPNYGRSTTASLFEDELTNQHCISSANTCAWFLAQAGIKKPFVVCPSTGTSTGLLEELESHGITDYVSTADSDGSQKHEFMGRVQRENIVNQIEQHPDVDAVVVGWDHHLTGLKIAIAAQYIRWGLDRNLAIPIITCGPDRSGYLGETAVDYCVGHGLQKRKVRAVGVGVMANAIHSCAEAKHDCINVGKPSMLLLEQLRRPTAEGGLEIDFANTILIGSTLETDIEFANKGGIRSLLVLSGVCDSTDLQSLQPSQTPTWVLENLADAWND